MIWRVGAAIIAILCSNVSCEDCEQEVHARPYDTARSCFGEPERVGCVPKGRSCPPTITYAIDASGRCFAFPD